MRTAKKIKRKLIKEGFENIDVTPYNGGVQLKGRLDTYSDIVKCGKIAVSKSHKGVVNDIELVGYTEKPMRKSKIIDKKYEGRTPDVLIVGAGIVGSAIARELSKYKLDTMLLEKEDDVATAQSSRNDGMIHAGIDLKPFTKKMKYGVWGNRLYDQLKDKLNIKLDKCGQVVLFTKKKQSLLYPIIKAHAVMNKTPIKRMTKEKVAEITPNAGYNYGGFFNSSAGITCPYQATIAFAESAVMNGVELCLKTAVVDVIKDASCIKAVRTNRGTIFPKVFINAAGIYSDVIAEMAGDRFFSIHPRKGIEIIFDKKSNEQARLTKSVIGIMKSEKSDTKGGGIVPTVDHNLLIGPNAKEIKEREDERTSREDFFEVWDKQKQTLPDIRMQDVITYFTGTRAPTYEEDFIVERSKKIRNLIQAAGIQSPGLTAAPAIAKEIANLVKRMLMQNLRIKVERKKSFNPIRPAIIEVKNLSDQERNKLIEENSDYGEIVCRCEEISKGEILDALRAPIKVPTLDGIKRRVRPGMGRCQGGFCSPLVVKIIAEEEKIKEEDVSKKGEESELFFGTTK